MQRHPQSKPRGRFRMILFKMLKDVPFERKPAISKIEVCLANFSNDLGVLMTWRIFTHDVLPAKFFVNKNPPGLRNNLPQTVPDGPLFLEQ